MLVSHHEKGESHATFEYFLLCIEETIGHTTKQKSQKKAQVTFQYILTITKFCSTFVT